MWRWLRNTRLFTQLEEIAAARRSLRVAEHRHSLRVKREAVRSRILYEIQRERIREAAMHMANAKLIARYGATQRVLAAHDARDRKLAELLRARGQEMPERRRPEAENDGDEFKNRMFDGVQGIVGESGGVVGKSLGREALKDSFAKVSVSGSEAAMAAGLVAGVAKEIGLSREELDRLVQTVERDGGDVGLRGAVMEALEKAPSSTR